MTGCHRQTRDGGQPAATRMVRHRDRMVATGSCHRVVVAADFVAVLPQRSASLLRRIRRWWYADMH